MHVYLQKYQNYRRAGFQQALALITGVNSEAHASDAAQGHGNTSKPYNWSISIKPPDIIAHPCSPCTNTTNQPMQQVPACEISFNLPGPTATSQSHKDSRSCNDHGNLLEILMAAISLL
jgi:hypothetical protein